MIDINTWQVERFVSGIIRLFHGTLAGKKLALFGYAFKENTSDSRESQSILVIRLLLQERLEQLSIYDPGCDVEVLRDELLRTFGPLHALVKVFQDPYTACEGSFAVLILTPWEEFKYPPCLAETYLAVAVEDSVLPISKPNRHTILTLAGGVEVQEGYLRECTDCPLGCVQCDRRSDGKGPKSRTTCEMGRCVATHGTAKIGI